MALDQSVVDSAGLGQQFDRRIFDLEGKSAAQEGDVADLQQQESELSAKRAQDARDAAAELKPSSDKLKEAAHKAADEPVVKEEQMADFKRPALDPQELQKTFGMLLVASMFAGKASRSPYNNTMTALTGAMNGFMKEDDRQVAESLKIYDTNLFAMKERNAALQRDMAANDRKNKNNVAAWTLEHDLILERYDFDDKAAGHEQKSLSDKVKRGETVLSSTEKAIDRLTTARAQIGERHEAAVERKRHDQEMEKVAAENAATRKAAAEKAGPGATAGLSEQYNADPEYKKKVDFWAKIVSTGTPLPTRFAQTVGKQFSGDVYSAATTMGTGDPSDMVANKIHLREINAEAQRIGTQSASVAIANKELERFIPPAEKAIDAVARTGWKPLNQLLQAAESTWSPEQKQLVVANRAVQNAYGALIQRGAPTVHSLQEAEKMLATADSPAVYKAAMQQLRIEGHQAELGLIDAREDLLKRSKEIGDNKNRRATDPKPGEETKTIGGKNYVKRDGKWFEQ